MLHCLPDPTPGEDSHYLSFEKVYGTKTEERHRPSLVRKTKSRSKSIGFYASQHVKNVDMVIQCEECEMWHLLYCRHKLTLQERATFQSILDDTAYTCGATLEDLDLPDRLAGVTVKDHSCYDMVEKLYYSCGYEPICIYCSSEDVEDSTEFFPLCRVRTAKG